MKYTLVLCSCMHPTISLFLAPEASDHGQGDAIDEWVHGVLTRMTREGKQHIWVQGEWHLMLDAWYHTDCHDMMALCQTHAMVM